VKPGVFVAAVLFSQFLFASPHSPTIESHYLQVLYSELKTIESESLRVVVTIEALEYRLREPPFPEDPEDLFLRLGSLYRDYAELDAYRRELNDQWNQITGTDDGSPVTFTSDQFKPIPTLSNSFPARLPENAIPLSDFVPVPVK
jgi:hypothetical protein